ncbi:MAG: carotenoid oxygenase family protein, partial [Pseudomonadota bacterium]
MSGAAAAGLLPGLAKAAASDSWQAEFAAALGKNPYLEGWRGTAQETLSASNLPIEGKLPAGLRGVFYRNGPARHEVGGLRYHHWFDGDGMVQSFRFTDQGISHLGRFVRTEKYAAELAAGRALRHGFGTQVPNAQPTVNPDFLNVANISILPHHGELLALWEGGSAYKLDPETLDTLGIKVWRPDLKGVPFSAHPKVDPNGTLWNFGRDSINSRLVLYQISRSGEVLKVGLVQGSEIGMEHDFAVTSRHMLFLLAPLRFSKDRAAQGASFLDSHEWVDGRAMRVLAIDKNDLATTQIFELPAGFMFHFGNAWEDAAGVIRFDYVRY